MNIGTDKPLVAVGQSWWKTTSSKVLGLEGQQLINAFNQTAGDLNTEESKHQGSILPWNRKAHPLYQGLLFLRRRADELQIRIVFDEQVMQTSAPWVLEILNNKYKG